MSTRTLILAAPLAAAVLAAAACGGYGGGNKSTTTESTAAGGGGQTTVAGEAANNHGTKDVSGESELKVEMDDFYFSPTVLTGKPGQKITLELENEGKVEHNLTIESEHINRDVEAGESAMVDVTIPKSGTVAFYCKYHRSSGMAGGLAVASSGY
jgi:plastocyanin